MEATLPSRSAMLMWVVPREKSRMRCREPLTEPEARYSCSAPGVHTPCSRRRSTSCMRAVVRSRYSGVPQPSRGSMPPSRDRERAMREPPMEGGGAVSRVRPR